eukprot:scaffold4614_cov247-Pinguiococcus_pyrenoidosus.AAC.7
MLPATQFDDECTEAEQEQCENIREANDVDGSLAWLYVLLLGVLIVGFRVIALMVLTQRAKSVY